MVETLVVIGAGAALAASGLIARSALSHNRRLPA